MKDAVNDCWFHQFHQWGEWKTIREGRLAIAGTMSVADGFEPIQSSDGNKVLNGVFEIQRRECERCKMCELRTEKTTL